MQRLSCNTLVIGGGFFGAYLAFYTKSFSPSSRVVLVEKENEIMKRASYNNQARIHNGYHYPRSFVTALRSRDNFKRFTEEFKECVKKDFKKYYAVSRINSKVTSAQFRLFCERIKAPLKPAPGKIASLFNRDYVEEVFQVKEYAFDADLLRQQMRTKLTDSGVEVILGCKAVKIKKNSPLGVVVKSPKQLPNSLISAQKVFVCLYAETNELLSASGIPKLDLKQQMTETCIVEVPDELKNLGVTVMCGPFFSFMPFPPEKMHSFTHVRYTPHFTWYDKRAKRKNSEIFRSFIRDSAFIKMKKDASRLIPLIEKFKYKKSLWEIKTLLPVSDLDDGRPVLFKQNLSGVEGLNVVIGGKIDNIYDLCGRIAEIK
ncbi:MAG TPA: FAD-dependent oxidoreductase [Candidatus Woesearchaeota archaeon]|nr:FAD-dependent oxidoreductase [Candidatus Woesearchaeota archaeon]